MNKLAIDYDTSIYKQNTIPVTKQQGYPDYSLTPYLIPIVITSNSMEEYKQRYNNH